MANGLAAYQTLFGSLSAFQRILDDERAIDRVWGGLGPNAMARLQEASRWDREMRTFRHFAIPFQTTGVLSDLVQAANRMRPLFALRDLEDFQRRHEDLHRLSASVAAFGSSPWAEFATRGIRTAFADTQFGDSVRRFLELSEVVQRASELSAMSGAIQKALAEYESSDTQADDEATIADVVDRAVAAALATRNGRTHRRSDAWQLVNLVLVLILLLRDLNVEHNDDEEHEDRHRQMIELISEHSAILSALTTRVITRTTPMRARPIRTANVVNAVDSGSFVVPLSTHGQWTLVRVIDAPARPALVGAQGWILKKYVQAP